MPATPWPRTSDEQPADGSYAATSSGHALDCYPYTFSPLLLFAQDKYFDKGYSNYNSVAAFFAPVLDYELEINMLDNVLYERKNMRYDELYEFVTERRMLVICCIDAHFTAFQVLGKTTLAYYDPLKPSIGLVTGEQSFRKLVCFLLLKCNYGDNQHLQESKSYYVGADSNPTRRAIYALWRDINKTEVDSLYDVRFRQASLNLSRPMFINGMRDFRTMSTQLTSCTCYFQSYLFAVLCKVGEAALADDGSSINIRHAERLGDATVRICHFLLEWFVLDAPSMVIRPLTNSNVVLDFYRFEEAPYFDLAARYLQSVGERIPDYQQQYAQLLEYFSSTKKLHNYGKFQLSATMPSAPNTKSLQHVCGTEDGVHRLGRLNYFKFRASNLMFGFNAGIMGCLGSFCEFNALRKNQLLAFYPELQQVVRECVHARRATTKYRDYYFMAQYEVGQPELVDLHHYTYEIDVQALLSAKSGARADSDLSSRVKAVNTLLGQHIYFSTQRGDDYHKFMSTTQFKGSKKYYDAFLTSFLSCDWFSEFAGLGLSEINPKEKEINSLTQTAFYSIELMARQAWRMEYEFEKECISQMARSTLREHQGAFAGDQASSQKYTVAIKIGHGVTYTKYNTLMHFLNVAQCYWQNPDLNAIQVFGKDIRAVLVVSCQKIFFERGHSYYHYGPIELPSNYGRNTMDLQVASSSGEVAPSVSREKRGNRHTVVVTDRVYEHEYLKGLLSALFIAARGARFKTDDIVLNLCLLSLLLDFGLFQEHAGLLNLPFLQSLKDGNRDARQLQVEVSNWLNEFDKKNTTDSVTRLKVEELLFETSYKFMINRGFHTRSKTFELIQLLNADPVYHQYVCLCKIYVSLCQINKSVEVDYYKVRANNEYRIIIPKNFSKATSDYLDTVTSRYTFTERNGFLRYGEHVLFDLRESQPEINLHKIRFDSATSVSSMVKYIEVSNVFRAVGQAEHAGVLTPRTNAATGATETYLIFIADNALLVEVGSDGAVTIRVNRIVVEIATVFFNEAISFVPCFKYADSEDIILFTSRNLHYLVDKAGQFNENYYGMKHELIECITSEQLFLDLNDEYIFETCKLSELLTESKVVVYFPDYLLQVTSRQQLINLLDFAIYVRNVSFFVLVLFYLRRCSIALDYVFTDSEAKVTKITGPWRSAIAYVLNRAGANEHYDRIFEKQFFDLNQHKEVPLPQFIAQLCENFTRYQRSVDGAYQIVPTEKQKEFLQRIITSAHPFHFSEVGSGKTKVILPLLCQAFLSNNTEAHAAFARGGASKHILVVLVPEHLVPDARAQVYRYCTNLNFRQDYRIYDDIFALLHDEVQLRTATPTKRPFASSMGRGGHFDGGAPQRAKKMIFITSFNRFKRALTYDSICSKVRPAREHMLLVLDEVDDFLDRDKLVFNICSNQSNSFAKTTLESYFEVTANPEYWRQLHDKFGAIHEEVQEKSKSINKSFGIFNEQTLKHSATNIAQDVEGYKSLIARPYESVNRAMPGSYYSDVERTIYLTYYVLMEDTAKYDELFQQERKFISYEYFSAHVRSLDYDDLVYGNICLSELIAKYPETKDGLTRFLYEIILRRMEIRDKSRSVNAIDVVFNFDCIGFTGTPFIDNYPTFSYLRSGREDTIPDLIDRSFYVYAAESVANDTFEERFMRFQGNNSHVLVEYVPSDFMRDPASDELATLARIFMREGGESSDKRAPPSEGVAANTLFNVLVDLCGLVKKTSIYAIRDLVLQHLGADRFHYIYHIDQTDGGDRILHLESENDVQFDEEFYNYLCKTYGRELRERVFFFVDNRNVIGKDVPFQLIHQKRFSEPLFARSVVVAHDVDDFSKIWQAMGRSRTMNDTQFTIYKSQMAEDGRKSEAGAGTGLLDIKAHPLTRALYVRNCDRKIAGNLSSIFQTLISLYNLSQDSFYYCDEIVNVFIEKMERTITAKVHTLEGRLARDVLGTPVIAGILSHILVDKFSKSATAAVSGEPITQSLLRALLRHVVEQKFEQRIPSGDVHDALLAFLSGEQEGTMEISYTKQQQKQRQRQQNKNQDADAMEVFDKNKQLQITAEMDDYFAYTLAPESDVAKISLNLPIAVPIFKLAYDLDGQRRVINVYPTLQFLYSHHLVADYITKEVKDIIATVSDVSFVDFCSRFTETVERVSEADQRTPSSAQAASEARAQLDAEVLLNHIRQSPQYTLAALREGVYLIGMKDQFNIHDLPNHPMRHHIQYIADEMGFILFSKEQTPRNSVDTFGPYHVEQYLLMDVLSKQEVAQNVLDYYAHRKEKLQLGVERYSEAQGKGFVCWRFINEFRKPAA